MPLASSDAIHRPSWLMARARASRPPGRACPARAGLPGAQHAQARPGGHVAVREQRARGRQRVGVGGVPGRPERVLGGGGRGEAGQGEPPPGAVPAVERDQLGVAGHGQVGDQRRAAPVPGAEPVQPGLAPGPGRGAEHVQVGEGREGGDVPGGGHPGRGEPGSRRRGAGPGQVAVHPRPGGQPRGCGHGCPVPAHRHGGDRPGHPAVADRREGGQVPAADPAVPGPGHDRAAARGDGERRHRPGSLEETLDLRVGLHGGEQRRAALRVTGVEPVGLDREQLGQIRMRAGQGDGRGRQQPRGGHDVLLVGPVPLAFGDERRGQREGQQDGQGGRDRDGGLQGPAALLDVLPDQGVLGHVPDRRGQVGHGVLQARVRRAEAVFLIRGPAQVHPARFLGERVPERLLGQRGGGAPVQVTRALVPDQLTPGERDEQVIGWPVRPPPGDLPGHPARLGRLRRGHQDQPGGAGHRLLDRRPQVRRGGQAGLVPEHVQGPHPVPGLGEVLQLALEPRGDRRVEPVAVGDEGVVAPLLACRHVPPGTVRPAFPVLPPFVTKSYKGIATGYMASRSR